MASLEIKVLYFTLIRSCNSAGFPKSLAMVIKSGTAAFVNGKRISNSEGALLNLRLDEAEEEESGSQTVTYIGTDHVGAKGCLDFQIRQGKDILMNAKIEEHGSIWQMECKRGPESGRWRNMQSMELGIVGNCLGSSVILNQSLDLEFGAKFECRRPLQVISEEERDECPQNNQRFWVDKLLFRCIRIG